MCFDSEVLSHSSTFQLVLRSDQYSTAPGEGQFGFFYGDITNPDVAEVGEEDFLAAPEPGT